MTSPLSKLRTYNRPTNGLARVETLETNLSLCISAIERLGHTNHCAHRLAFGDGECECQRESPPVDAAGREDAGLPRADEPMETLSADELEAIEEGRHPWTVDELLSRMEYDEDYSDMATLRGAIGKERAQRAEEIARLKERSAALETELIQSEADCGATLAESDDKLQEMLSERDAATARAEKAESRVRDNQAEIDRLALSRRLAAQTLRDLAPAQNNGLKTLEQHVDDASSYITSLQSEVTRLTAALKESESRVVFLGGQLNSKPCAANLPVAIPESGEGQ